MDINTFIIIMIAGISTGIGAIPIYFKKEYNQEFLDLGLGFSAGVMLIASFSALLFPSIASAELIYGNKFGVVFPIIGLIVGYKIIIHMHNLLPHKHLLGVVDKNHRAATKSYLIVIAICLHNIPEGLSVGVGFGGTSFENALSIAIAISIQNLPEGLVVALGILQAGSSRNKAFIIALLSGLVEPIAAIIGFIGTSASTFTLPFAMAFAGGAMLFVVCQEMLPELFNKDNIKESQKGMMFGFATMLLIINFLS